MKKRKSQYNVIDVSSKLGISLEEAEKIVEARKSATAGTLENFIKRHGEIIGRTKFEEFKSKSKSSIENFKKRYNDEWEEKWNNYLATRDSSSLEFCVRKYGK